MYTNPNPNLTPQCRARKYEQTNGWTDGHMHDGHNAMTIARWHLASGAKNWTSGSTEEDF